MKLLIHGYFGYGNAGDEAILTALIQEYKARYPNAEFIVLSVNPQRTCRIHGVKAVRERLLSLSFWRELLRANVLVFAGGGRYGYATWRRIALLALLAKLLGKSTAFRAVGVYPYEWRGSPIISDRPEAFRGLTATLIKLALNSADYVSVRDFYSYAVLRLTGVRSVAFENDPALGLKIPGPSYCRDLAVKYGLVDGGVLGINLRTLDDETNRVVVDFVAKLIRNLLSRDFSTFIFIPFGFGSFENRFFDDDLIVARMLKLHIPELKIVAEELSPLQILCLFNYMNYVIAMRHHAIIFALLANKPLTAIIYDTKSLDLLKRLNAKQITYYTVNELINQRLTP